MQMLKAARGRPKGTGLDDATILADLRALLARDPALRPTTAIKSLGISNPSVIRRLRDKLGTADAGTLSTVASVKPRAVALGSTPEPRRKGPIQAASSVAPIWATAKQDAHPGTVAKGQLQTPAIAAWLTLGVEVWMASARLQLTLVEQVMRLPELNPLLRHHAALMGRTSPADTSGDARAPLLN